MVAEGSVRVASRKSRSLSNSLREAMLERKGRPRKKIENEGTLPSTNKDKLLTNENKKRKQDSSCDSTKNVENKENASKSSNRSERKKYESKSHSKKDKSCQLKSPEDTSANVSEDVESKAMKSLKGKDVSEQKKTKNKMQKEKGKMPGRSSSSSSSKKAPVKLPDANSDSDDCDFSKIEGMIFEGHTSGTLPTSSKKYVSEKGKGRIKKDVGNTCSSKDSRVQLEKNSGKTHKKQIKESVKNKEVKSKKHKSSPQKGKGKANARADASDSESSDWEEVEDDTNEINELEALLNDSQESTVMTTQESVKIELDAPDVVWGMKKRRKKRTEEEMIEEYLRKHVNRSIKESFENMHKSHLLCLFAQGQYFNKTLNSELLLGSALSIITDKNAYPPKRLDMNYLEKFVNWFSRKITRKHEDVESNYWSIPLETLLVKRFESKVALTNRELVFMFIVICRALGMNVRLVISLQPLSWKPTAGALIKQIKEEKESTGVAISKPSCSKMSEKCEKATGVKLEVDAKCEKPTPSNNRRMLSSDSDHDQRPKKKAKSHSKKKALSDDSDSDFEPISTKIKNKSKSYFAHKRNSTDSNSEKSKKRKSIENEEKQKKKKKSEPLIEWAEIYVEEEEKWMCIDITKSKIHCIQEIEARTPSGSAYITAFNGDLTVKDVTRRYIASWLSNENKIRCCTKWWGKALRGFRGKRSRLDKEEDDEMDQNLREQPLPKSIGEYKNHPLYALQRHLLKFEAIYPPDEAPVGYIRGEPVFPRSSVYTLCSRDTWMKEAKTVRVGEEPYKIVKARPKWDRNTCQVVKDRPLEVFGEWQVEDFEPPVASGGKVPRNEYGNVELFKPSMLPKGCVHLPIAGLNRIAKKLGIDCAPAMIGFDFHSGWTHPVYEGYVVCEEFKDTLLDAWNEDQVEQARRAEEKREKKIYDNWKKLIRGMMVRERVREKYGTYEVPEDEVGENPPADEEADEGQEKGKGKGKKGSKKVEQKKTKITQDDINAARPSRLPHEDQSLHIDLTSNVVEMAKASRKSTMKSRNAVKAKDNPSKSIENKDLPSIKPDSLDNSSDETDEEEKKEKIRAILKWGTKAVGTNPNLSDDSDNEGNSNPSNSFIWKYANFDFPIKPKNAKKREGKRSGLSDSEKESVGTSRSTTPEPDANEVTNVVPRRVPRRSTKVNKVKYEESDDDGDISLDESDVEDKTYNPLKKKNEFLDLSESD